ncbi:hypothetical protein [Paracoccus nototheniae]|uniref:Uncharacterized protein n=1 Tax=Paracoccus nototheniae TaxID=2489002 RepID=A0ABW4E0K1_9RHOB|nr:hypothetical protein [Paracoccus nototheniae]
MRCILILPSFDLMAPITAMAATSATIRQLLRRRLRDGLLGLIYPKPTPENLQRMKL